jgi:formylmethanofuran--tetrahydromethanopterin N-formyltransferase
VRINGVEIEDTYAEAFGMWAARVIVTAASRKWALTAAQVTTGFATSIIGCGCEAGVERELSAEETPDGRPGVSLLLFARSREDLQNQLFLRVGQGVMTCATTACYNGLPGEEQVSVGGKLRFFGDGFQSSKLLDGRRFWRIPVMEGEFLVEERFGIQKGVAGGNLLILGESKEAALAAAEAAVAAMRQVEGVVMPFPGGIVRSGSKVGSRYKFLIASTNAAYCPTLRRVVDSAVPDGVEAVLEIVALGLTEGAVREAMRVGIEAACRPGIVRISAGNYGGKLGRYHIRLWELWQ